MGYSEMKAARFSAAPTSSVNRLAVSQELPDLKKYGKAL
jgi:hypothetical protein